MSASYELTGTDGAECACGSTRVKILRPKNPDKDGTLAAFYICRDCGRVGEIGKGPVGKLTDG